MRQLENLRLTYQGRTFGKLLFRHPKPLFAGKKKERLDRLSPGKTQKPKGTFSRAALSCDERKES